MKRLHIYRHGGLEITLRAFGRYWAFCFTTRGWYGNGRSWWTGTTRCLCAWYGPDLYDGCSECGA